MTRRPLIRTILVLVVIGLLIVGLHTAARFGLRGPTAFSVDAFGSWFDDPVAVVATICRWLALISAYYLFAVVAALAFLDPARVPPSVVRFVPPGLASAIGLALGLTATAAPAVIHMKNADPTPEPPSALILSSVDNRLVLAEHEPVRPIPMAPPTHNDPPILAAAPPPERVTVETGDSLWSIAEEMLVDSSESTDTLTEETIGAYWRVLIEANQDRLIEPGNPDLIMPGQELILPPISRGTVEG